MDQSQVFSKLSSMAAVPGAWALTPGQALRLPIGPGRRELRVLEGQLWLTADGRPGRPARDIWLSAGDVLSLPSGANVVLEAWPEARFQLLVPPTACAPWQRGLLQLLHGLSRGQPDGLASA